MTEPIGDFCRWVNRCEMSVVLHRGTDGASTRQVIIVIRAVQKRPHSTQDVTL